MCNIKIAGALLLFLCGWMTAAAAQMPGLPSLTLQPSAKSTAEPSLDDLISILENEASRTKLIQSLKAAAYVPPSTAEAATVTGAAAAESESLPGRIARYSQVVIATAIAAGERVLAALDDARDLLSGARSLDLPRVFDAILPVGVVALVVFGVLTAMRLGKTWIVRRLSPARTAPFGAVRSRPMRKLFVLAILAMVDIVTIALSVVGGYLAAVIFYGGAPNINQALFLNAFLVIEAVRAGFDLFVAPRYPQFRLTPFGDKQARYWYFWISRLISILGYTFLFVAPIVERSSNMAAGDATRFIVAFLSLCLIVGLILQNRTLVRDRLGRKRAGGDRSLGAWFHAALGDIWWLVAIAFVLTLFSVWLSSPDSGLQFMTVATLKSIAAMAVGGLVSSVLAKIIANGIPVPQGVKDRLPLFERHLNSFIPNALTVVRVLVAMMVIATILEAWSILDLRGWSETEVGRQVVGGIIGASVVILVGFLIYLGLSSWVEYRLNPNFGSVPTARERTLLALFRNGFTVALAVLTGMLVLSQIGIDIGPLLAGAGVVGLAVGFGAQKLVQDIITGAFIQLENAMNVGDVVEVAGVSGLVERLTIRSVGLRSLNGTYHLIPFSTVDRVANMTKDFSQFVADVGVAYRESVAEVKEIMQEAFNRLRKAEIGSSVIGTFELFGVEALGASSVTVRGRIKTLPGQQWAVGRAYNETVKDLCDQRGVELAFPNMTVWFGEDKHGKAPPVPLPSPALIAEIATRMGEDALERSAPSRRLDGAETTGKADEDKQETGAPTGRTGARLA